MDSLIGVHLRSSAVPPFRFPPANGCFRFSLERPLDRAGGDGMLRLVVTCESDVQATAGVVRSFASSVAATLLRPAARQGFMPTAAFDLSCTLGRAGRARVPKSRLRGPHPFLGSGAIPCMPGRLPRPALLLNKPLLKESLMKFEELGLAEPLLRAVRAQGYPTTTKIQAAAIPPVLAGRDVLGLRTDGHRQDGRLRPAHLAAAQPRRVPRQRPRPQDPHPGARPHARAGAANLRELPGLRPLYGRAPGGHLRRRRPVAASAGPERGRRHPDRHAGPAA